MTGKDVKRQVLEYGALTPGLKAALAPCVVLTREEAEKVKHALNIGPLPETDGERAALDTAWDAISPADDD